MDLLARVSWIAIGLAAVHLVISVGMVVVGNTEGWVGGCTLKAGRFAYDSTRAIPCNFSRSAGFCFHQPLFPPES